MREGYETGNKQQIRYGMAQLSGTAAYMTAAKLALPALIAAGFGISKKENPEKDNKNASQLAPSYYEGNDLQVVTSDMIYGPNITKVTKTAPVTEVPGYNSFTMNITGASVGSLAEVFVWAYDYSPADWRFKTIPYTIGSAVLLTEAAGLCKQITRNLASDYYYG